MAALALLERAEAAGDPIVLRHRRKAAPPSTYSPPSVSPPRGPGNEEVESEEEGAASSPELAEEQEGLTVQPRLIGELALGKTTGETVLEAAHGVMKEHDNSHDSDDDHLHDHDGHIGDEIAGHLDDHDDEALFGKEEPEEDEGEGAGTSIEENGVQSSDDKTAD